MQVPPFDSSLAGITIMTLMEELEQVSLYDIPQSRSPGLWTQWLQSAA